MTTAHRARATHSPGLDHGDHIAVLKFGSSVLACPRDYTRAAEVIAAEVARGRKVVAVVSAMGETTDSLLSAARSVTPVPSDTMLGALLATGEEASVALLSLALAARGVCAVGFNASRVPLRTSGALQDADPVFVDAGQIRAAFRTRDAVVFPGFIGVDMTGVASLLGRGGSDLTALFLGDALEAAEIRLIKDVDGIFPSDPRSGSAVQPFRELSWDRAREIGGGVVQPKAIDFAERRRLRFRVTGLRGEGTSIGARVGWPVLS
ncbi:MAG: hypothetical protein OXK77_14595 [Gemmatimonadota bacterium]|nr:hypothetical protein [Gemmatimonadota bacterium]MDE2784182.1 hypothetical protein [Gemmatimonadota bacterium]MDE2864045.1 hypothetical protein [Gemmatimonadota bacterium]MYB07034.1 hypothetical protein [Gemmatimonadota bacterium]MYE18138.1 hypothetical protein [Gemmatimonadota bacterium]